MKYKKQTLDWNLKFEIEMGLNTCETGQEMLKTAS